MVKNSVELVDIIGKTLLSRKVVGEKSTSVKTASLSMVLYRQRPQDLSLYEDEEDQSSFRLPQADILLLSKKDAYKFIDSQVRSLAFFKVV